MLAFLRSKTALLSWAVYYIKLVDIEGLGWMWLEVGGHGWTWIDVGGHGRTWVDVLCLTLCGWLLVFPSSLPIMFVFPKASC